MQTLEELLGEAFHSGASDLVLTAGQVPQLKIDGKMCSFGDERVTAASLDEMIPPMLEEQQRRGLAEMCSVDFSRGFPGLSRFRFNVFRQRGALALAARVIPHQVPRLDSLGLPQAVLERMAMQPSGLVLFTGATGSGKSTSMAAVLDFINRSRQVHVICLEDPVEFLHQHGACTIEQREIGSDTPSFAHALRDVFRQAPDVVMVGELRDLESIDLTLKLAETGHLVFGTLHTQDAVQTVSRIVHSFPPDHQQQAYLQLSAVLNGVIAQQLLPRTDAKGRVLCCEVLVATPAVRNLIREQQQHQIYSVLQTGREEGMCTMNEMLLQHVRAGTVTQETALAYSMRQEELRRMLSGI